MSKRNPHILLEDILGSIKKISKYKLGLNKVSFLQDEKTLDAVIRNLEIIGEASKSLSAKFKKNNDNIPWHKIAGLRNRIVHEYFGLDPEILWQIVENELPTLEIQIQSLFDDTAKF